MEPSKTKSILDGLELRSKLSLSTFAGEVRRRVAYRWKWIALLCLLLLFGFAGRTATEVQQARKGRFLQSTSLVSREYQTRLSEQAQQDIESLFPPEMPTDEVFAVSVSQFPYFRTGVKCPQEPEGGIERYQRLISADSSILGNIRQYADAGKDAAVKGVPLIPGNYPDTLQRVDATVWDAASSKVPWSKRTYFVAINLVDSCDVLPSLMRAIVNTARFLGGRRLFLSVYENGSKDRTADVLHVFKLMLDKLVENEGIDLGYTIIAEDNSDVYASGERIMSLVRVRNKVLEPLRRAHPKTFSHVLFLNDVHVCVWDILELMLEHERQQADMSCGMDYKELQIPEFEQQGYPLLFYDMWVARDMEGLTFYTINAHGDWELPEPPLRRSHYGNRFHEGLPFQVYSCFNGVSLIRANVFLEANVYFRAEVLDGQFTDVQSECYLLCEDLWRVIIPWDNGLGKERGGRIQVVPRAAVAYTEKDYYRARKEQLTGWRNSTEIDNMGPHGWYTWPPRRIFSYPYGDWHSFQWRMPF